MAAADMPYMPILQEKRKKGIIHTLFIHIYNQNGVTDFYSHPVRHKYEKKDSKHPHGLISLPYQVSPLPCRP